MRKEQGFTFIEIVIFIIVSSLMLTALLLVYTNALKSTPSVLQNTIARQAAKACMEWFVGQRSINGYSTITCPSTSVPSFCTAPSGYTLSVSISCTTINSDANYKTIAVTVSGKGAANLTTLIANY